MADFCPKMLSEEPTPDHLENCRECGLYEQGTRMVWGEGNPEAPIMIILDNPGRAKIVKVSHLFVEHGKHCKKSRMRLD